MPKYSFGKFPVKVSARHVHLQQETVDILFGKGHEIKPAEGPAKGEFCSDSRVTIVGPKHTFERVAVMGPCRKFDQVEVSATDARTLGIAVPVRDSGDHHDTPGIKIVGPAGEVTLDKGLIVAARHIHLGKTTAEQNGLANGDMVLMAVESDGRFLIFGDTAIHTNGPDNGSALCHIDTDEGNAAGMGKQANGYILGKMEDFKDLFQVEE